MEQAEQQAPAMSAEQAADFAELQAGAQDQAAALTPEAAPGPDLAGEIASLALAFVAIAKPMFPSLGRIYTEQTTATAAAAVAAVCNKHGWLQDGMMGEWGEEIGAAVVIVPLAIATVQGVKGDLAMQREAQKQIGAAAGPVEAPDGAAPVWGQVTPQPEASLENH